MNEIQWGKCSYVDFLHRDITEPVWLDDFVEFLHDSPDDELAIRLHYKVDYCGLTSSTNAVLYRPKKTLPRIAFNHLVGIGSCSVSIVLTRSCMSS